MNQTEGTIDITKSEIERACLEPTNVNLTMYSTVDAKASNTKGAWN